MRKEQSLAATQMRSDLFRVNGRHLRVRKRQKKNIRAPRRFRCAEHFETAPSGAHPGLAPRIKPDDYLNSAVLEVEGVRASLRTEADHRARFALQPAKIGVFVSVNASGQIYLRGLPKTELAAASNDLSSLSVSPPRKRRIRRNDWQRNRSAAE